MRKAKAHLYFKDPERFPGPPLAHLLTTPLAEMSVMYNFGDTSDRSRRRTVGELLMPR